MLKIFVLLVMVQTPTAEVKVEQAGSYSTAEQCQAGWQNLSAAALAARVPANKMAGVCIETPWMAPGAEI